MNDFTRLLSGDATELESLLLSSVEDDAPAEGSLEKVGAALGVSASALVAASAGAVAVAGQAAAAANATALSKSLTWLGLSKWLTVGLGAGLVTGGAAHLVSRALTAPRVTFVAVAPEVGSQPLRVNVPRRAREGTSLPVTAPLEATNAPVTTPLESAAPPSSNPPRAAAALALPASGSANSPVPAGTGSASFESEKAPDAVVPEPPTSTLSNETKALDRARQALGAGRTADALAALDGYRTSFPRGSLAAEAALLRVDALLRSGQRQAAEREAKMLVAQAPGSRYATRARALLAAGTAK